MAGTVEESQPFTAHFIVGSTGQLEFSAPEYHVTGGVPTATLTVQRVGGHDGPLTVAYSGALDDYSFRRMILHNAHLCALAGGVDPAGAEGDLLRTGDLQPLV